MYILTVMGREDPPRHFISLGSMRWWMMDYCTNYATEPLSFLVEERVDKNMPIACDSVVVALSKEVINRDLTLLGPQLEVVGSRITEDGYELILEGPQNQLEDILFSWSSYVS